MHLLNADFASAQLLQHRHGLRHHSPWAVALVHQPFDDAQLFDLCHGVGALVVGITPGSGETIATFPHAQGVFANAGVAFDGCNGQRHVWMVFT